MTYETIKDESPKSLHCMTSVEQGTFNAMIAVLEKAERDLKKQRGRPSRLSLEGKLRTMLSYLIEYKTYSHISRDYGISKSSCYRNVCCVKDVLIKEGKFSLPWERSIVKK